MLCTNTDICLIPCGVLPDQQAYRQEPTVWPDSGQLRGSLHQHQWGRQGQVPAGNIHVVATGTQHRAMLFTLLLIYLNITQVHLSMLFV